MYHDAHIHLMDISILKNAQKNGVISFILNATNLNEWDDVLNLSNQIKCLYPCIGIHPWFIKNIPHNWVETMECHLKQNPTLMVGEIGLDYTKEDRDTQLFIFEKSIELASKYHRPIHIHSVKAWHDILRIIKKYPNEKYLFHKFSASLDVIKKLSNFNAYFSISETKDIHLLPVHKILVETDSPYHNKTPQDIILFIEKSGLNKQQLEQNFNNFVSF